MKYPRSILQGYSKPIEKMIANVLHMPLNDKRKGGGKLKIPKALLKKASKEAKGKVKKSSLKAAKNDNDVDDTKY